jgi:hypothetical protein
VAFVAAAWPLSADVPDVAYWAGKFIEAGHTSVTVA